MRFLLAVLHNLFPRLKPRGTWNDAKLVTNYTDLNRFNNLYLETVAWVKAKDPKAIQAPDCLVKFRYWPKNLRVPKGFDGLLGRVLSPNVIPGDTYGTLLIQESWLKNDSLIIHECKHAITGIPDHPTWLFPT